MNRHFGLFIFVLLCKICILMDLVYSSSLETNLDILQRKYGEGYGTEWIYFPDGDGQLHYVNLSMRMEEGLALPAASTPDIEFRLYNGNKWNNSYYILLDKRGRAVNDNEQDHTNYIMRLDLPIKIITHGWRSSANIEDILNIKTAYLAEQNVNVITVDWNPMASYIIYFWAAMETKNAGSQIASFLGALNEEYGVTGDMIHLIGHSLGAHVMGAAASQTNRKVHRVTGLDPAKPFFELIPLAERIDSSNAEIVDVIHTCAGVYGITGAVGTVDFYPNGGTFPQPGCEGLFNMIDACSHSICMYYFKESIKYRELYPAYRCKSWNDFDEGRCNRNNDGYMDNNGFMGDVVNKSMKGTHYLHTNGRESYIYLKKHIPLPHIQTQPDGGFSIDFNLNITF